MFLIKNSHYQIIPYTSAKEKYKEMKKAIESKDNWYYDTDWYIPPMEIELNILNKFLNISKFDWNIIKPLYDKGLIWVNDGDGKIKDACLSHLSEEYRNHSKKSIGTVRNYVTKIDYFHFWIGKCNPNNLVDKTNLTEIK